MASGGGRGEGGTEEAKMEAQGSGSRDGETAEEESKEGGKTKATPHCACPEGRTQPGHSERHAIYLVYSF